MGKPIILSIDDDPEVLGAVVRDLRQRFKGAYRIVKASSGAEALEVTRQLKARNDVLALFVADERMPGMSGTEFLAEARKLYPDARKVLLTAYADTSAAISGINEVGLDHYLMKPWDPPEDNLYPVLDDLLDDWTASYRPPFEGIRVAGTPWSPHSYAVRDFLSRTQIPYQWIDLERDDAMRALALEASPDLARLPVVYFPDGTTLVEPALRELASQCGLKTQAAERFYDVLVLGGGPSGLAGAVYGASEGLRTALIETDAPGGQAGTSSQIENYLGFPSGVSGADLARRASTQAQRFGAEIVCPRQVVRVRRQDPYRIVELEDGTELSACAVLVATGMQVRRLEAPGIQEFTGAGVYYGAALTEAASCRDRHVMVIGGANSAGQAAMLLCRYAAKVSVVVRGPDLKASMSQYLITRIDDAPNVEVLTHTQVASVAGDRRLSSVTLAGPDGQRTVDDVFAMFIFIGSAPRSDAVADLVERDEKGFVLTGPDLLRAGRRPKGWTLDRDPYLLETSVPGVFAVGDIRGGSMKRVASAVGEGSAAISMVHRYLETV
ncbi:MAG: FAD-dependent oxidoreductase [Alphaproteobacteria bacterium]|nr:FAD-dependent oxidoreductase [Alphaproteobacteria bacterium]